ncbi:MAG: hypothetical protein ACP5US_02145 [Candidatus Kryptoniota bacterium]
MIPVFVFWLHITAAVYLFSKKYYEDSLGEAFLSVAFAAIIFTAGWTLSSFIINFTLGSRGLSKTFNGDSLSLILLTVLEIVFYRFWFKKSGTNAADA